MIYIIAGLTFLSTILGGLIALRLREQLHLILGFSAGAVLGLSLFELLPEAIELTEGVHSSDTVFTLVGIGFGLYLLLDRFFRLHGHDHETQTNHKHGTLGAGSLSLHSFLDGVSIGLSFHHSMALGVIVAVAILAHDFSDGINTVNVIIKSGGDKIKALKWLALDAIAPILGVVVTFFFTISSSTLGLLFALFGGFFLYIGASDLIPESFHSHNKKWTTFMTIMGMLLLYSVTHIGHF